MQVDSFAPAHSAFGFPIYVAPLPAGSIQRVCHDTLDFIQVPGYPSAMRVFTLTHSSRNVVPTLAVAYLILVRPKLGDYYV